MVYRGQTWARLLDDYLATVVASMDHPPEEAARAWSQNAFTLQLAHAILAEHQRTPSVAHLAPCTILGALHRTAHTARTTERWYDLHRILTLQADFARACSALPGSTGQA